MTANEARAQTRHVFISYVREDAKTVEELARALNARGIETWLDREQLKPGEYWADAIRSAIESGAFFLACFSRQSALKTDSYMNEELTLAIEELRRRPATQGWFIPVLLDGTSAPERSISGRLTLRSLEWVDLAIGWDEGIARLLLAIDPNGTYLADVEQALEGRSARARIAALDRAAKMGAAAAQLEPKVIEQLQHENQTVRRAAVGALIAIAGASSDVIYALLVLIARSWGEHHRQMFDGARPDISSKYPYDADAAARCLSKLGEGALDSMLRSAETEPELLGAVLEVLAHVTDIETAPLLVRQLSHADPRIRARSAHALGRIFGHDGFSNFLRDRLPLDASPRPHDARLASLDAVTVLGRALLDPDDQVRASAAFALGRIGPRSATELDKLLTCLDDPSDFVRGQAVRALPHIAAVPSRVLPRLIELLGDETFVANGAAFALSSMGIAEQELAKLRRSTGE